MDYTKTHLKAIKIFLVIGLIGFIGFVFSGLIGRILSWNSGEAIITIILSLIWVTSGLPSVWGYVVEVWGWITDHNGCLMAILFILFGIFTIPLVLGVIFILAPIRSIRILANARRKKKEAKKRSYTSEFQGKADDAIRQCENNWRKSEETGLQPEYKAIDLQKNLWDALDDVSTSLQLLDDKINGLTEKRDTEVVKLNEYRKKRDDMQRQAQDNITRLEKIEKEFHELAIDYKVVAGEFEHSLNAIYSKARDVGSGSGDVSKREKDSRTNQLQIHLSQSNQEIGNLRKLESTDEHYLEYFRKLQKQRAIVSDIERNISQINSLGAEVNGSF